MIDEALFEILNSVKRVAFISRVDAQVTFIVWKIVWSPDDLLPKRVILFSNLLKSMMFPLKEYLNWIRNTPLRIYIY